MERGKAIKTAAAASLTLLAGGAGIALNSGIVGASGQDKVGTLTPVASVSSAPVTVYADAPAAVTAQATPAIQPTNAKPLTTSTASGYRASDGHDGGDHHYEGAEDDD